MATCCIDVKNAENHSHRVETLGLLGGYYLD